jgi:hypothetical protein
MINPGDGITLTITKLGNLPLGNKNIIYKEKVPLVSQRDRPERLAPYRSLFLTQLKFKKNQIPCIDQAKSFVVELSNVRICTFDVLVIINDKSPHGGGAWMHQDIVPEFAIMHLNGATVTP